MDKLKLEDGRTVVLRRMKGHYQDKEENWSYWLASKPDETHPTSGSEAEVIAAITARYGSKVVEEG